jgi:hypothetical protein
VSRIAWWRRECLEREEKGLGARISLKLLWLGLIARSEKSRGLPKITKLEIYYSGYLPIYRTRRVTVTER